jgi:hypothetical protein
MIDQATADSNVVSTVYYVITNFNSNDLLRTVTATVHTIDDDNDNDKLHNVSTRLTWHLAVGVTRLQKGELPEYEQDSFVSDETQIFDVIERH